MSCVRRPFCVYGALLLWVGWISSATDIDIGLRDLENGRFDSARTRIVQAYQRNAADPRAKIAYAAFLHEGNRAETLLSSIVSDSSAGDSLRAVGHERLGALSYAKADYASAADHYEQAYLLARDTELKIMWALSELNGGNDANALSMLRATVLQKSGPIAKKAYLYLGNGFLKQKNFSRALDCYSEAIEAGPSSAWYVPALAGRCICAAEMGFANRAKHFREELNRDYPGFLEQGIVDDAFSLSESFDEEDISPSSSGLRQSSQDAAIPIQRSRTYTAQVGSFRSIDNANTLRTRLNKLFDGVRIVPAVLDGSTYYRVRIGSFQSSEDAERFARRQLKKRRISYRVLAE